MYKVANFLPNCIKDVVVNHVSRYGKIVNKGNGFIGAKIYSEHIKNLTKVVFYYEFDNSTNDPRLLEEDDMH